MPKVVIEPEWTSGMTEQKELRTEVEVEYEPEKVVILSMITGDTHLQAAITVEEWNAMAHAVDALLYDVVQRSKR